MRYYYFNPFNKQYLFPEGFKNHSTFDSFYQPYTLSGHLIWNLWRSSSLLRRFCLSNSPEKLVPINQIHKYITASSILAFNRGTPGVEQKITILGIDQKTKNEFFIKYAESPKARYNVNNEGLVLQQLNHLNFVPKLNAIINTDEYTLLNTNVLNGKRLTKQPEDKEMLTKLKQIAKQSIKTSKNNLSELETCFAHGDFCPWNMMLHNNQLLLFDWEMAGTYPLGYDLFTCIFQTSMLLTPKISFQKLIQKNKTLTSSYFSAFEIKNWKPYLIAFAQIKLEQEIRKQNLRLVIPFQKLSSFLLNK